MTEDQIAQAQALIAQHEAKRPEPADRSAVEAQAAEYVKFKAQRQGRK
jgi:hypothetical protein